MPAGEEFEWKYRDGRVASRDCVGGTLYDVDGSGIEDDGGEEDESCGEL